MYIQTSLRDEMTNEYKQIILEETNKATAQLAANILKIPPRIPSLQELENAGYTAAENSVKRICLSGAAQQGKAYLPYIIGGLVGLIIAYVMFKKK